MTSIFHLVDTYRIGGPGKTILNSARFVDRTRFQIGVAAFTPLDTRRSQFSAAVQRVRLPFLDLPETGRFNLHHAGRLRKHLREHHVDLLHTHGYRSDVLGLVATRGLPVALVTTHHGWIRNSRRQRVAARLAIALSRWFDGVEVVSAPLLAELPRSVRESERVAVVHNALVLEDYVPRNYRESVRAGLGVHADSPLIAVIGRLSVEKGCLEMIEAFGELAGEDARLHLVFVGEGPLEFELARLARGRDWRDRLHLVGHQAAVQPFLEAADLVVSPSRTEGLSNVILEALAFRRPVVATRVGGNPEIIEDGVCGLLVEPHRPQEIAEGIRRLLRDDLLRERCAENGRTRVATAFSFEGRMRAEERFYERILRARGARPSLVAADTGAAAARPSARGGYPDAR